MNTTPRPAELLAGAVTFGLLIVGWPLYVAAVAVAMPFRRAHLRRQAARVELDRLRAIAAAAERVLDTPMPTDPTRAEVMAACRPLRDAVRAAR